MTLFQAQSGRLPFGAIADDMAIVAEALRALFSGRHASIIEAQLERDEIASGQTPVPDGASLNEVLRFYEMIRVPSEQACVTAIVEGAGLLLVFAFLERSLREVCEHHESAGKKVDAFVRSKTHQGKIQSYLDYLSDVAGLRFSVPDEFAAIMRREKKLRDLFAHGDWDVHYVATVQGESMRSLLALTPLLTSIESASIDLMAV